MYVKITSTITTLIDLDSFKPEHKILIECDEDLPQDVILAAAIGGLKSSLASIDNLSEDKAKKPKRKLKRKNPPITDEEY